MLVGNDGGVDVSVSNSDPGTTNGDFTTSDIGYNTTQFYGADKVKGYHQYIAGAQDNGTWLSNRSEDASSSEFLAKYPKPNRIRIKIVKTSFGLPIMLFS